MTDSVEAPCPASSRIENEVTEVLAEFGGDHRAAIAALLTDIATLARDYAGAVSRGFMRRGADTPARRRRAG